MPTSLPSFDDDAFIAYKKEVVRSRDVILSMPIINQDLKSMHEFMIDQFNGWVIKLELIEAETVKVPKKRAKRVTKRVTKKVVDVRPKLPTRA